ncbi:methyltransferase [Dactylosporangium sp. CA-139066]|uniref:methyltransferase n=1 Tax=Dactylosporangium sp. CA-139066 TaxID=3239930 RepID=UPI003D935988
MVTKSALAARRTRFAAALARGADGYVPTPPMLAEILTGYPYSTLSSLPDRAVVVEPSAGTGPIVSAILDRAPHVTVVAIEPDPDRVASLRNLASQPGHHRWTVSVHPTTFEDYTAEQLPGHADAVIVNPPWSTPGKPNLWVAHVLAAWRLLRPGARLVAVVPYMMARPDHVPTCRAGRELRALVDAHGVADLVDVADLVGRDKTRGFPAKVAILRLTRPIPTPDGRPSWLLSRAPGAPVPVRYLDLGPTGAQHAPVQQYQHLDGSTRTRVLRFAGTCAGCDRLLWLHDDGSEDASLWTAASSIEAHEHGCEGPTIGMCLECGHDTQRVTRALRQARPYWTARPA